MAFSFGLMTRDWRSSPGDHPINGRFKVDQLYSVLPLTRSTECGLVHKIGEIGPDESGRARGDPCQIDLLGQRHLARVYSKDFSRP